VPFLISSPARLWVHTGSPRTPLGDVVAVDSAPDDEPPELPSVLELVPLELSVVSFELSLPRLVPPLPVDALLLVASLPPESPMSPFATDGSLSLEHPARTRPAASSAVGSAVRETLVFRVIVVLLVSFLRAGEGRV